MADTYWKQYRSKIKDAKQGLGIPTSNKKNKKYNKKNYTLYVQHSGEYMAKHFDSKWQRLLKLKQDGTRKIGTYGKLRDVENAIIARQKSFWAKLGDTYFYIDSQGNKFVYENNSPA